MNNLFTCGSSRPAPPTRPMARGLPRVARRRRERRGSRAQRFWRRTGHRSDALRSRERPRSRHGPADLPARAAPSRPRRAGHAPGRPVSTITSSAVMPRRRPMSCGSASSRPHRRGAPRAPGVTGSPARPPPLASVSSFPITSEVERIVAICLSPDRRDRFPTVKSLEGALAALPEAKVSPSPHVVAEPTADEDDIGADSDRPTVPPTSGVTLSRTANVEMPAPRRAGRTST